MDGPPTYKHPSGARILQQPPTATAQQSLIVQELSPRLLLSITHCPDVKSTSYTRIWTTVKVAVPPLASCSKIVYPKGVVHTVDLQDLLVLFSASCIRYLNFLSVLA